MNYNAIVATLVIKGIITEDEGDRLVNFLHDKPQSTLLRDSIAEVSYIISKPNAAQLAPLGPVGPTQQAEELAARNAVADPPLPEPTPPSDTKKQDKAATHESAKPTSDDKPKEDAPKK